MSFLIQLPLIFCISEPLKMSGWHLSLQVVQHLPKAWRLMLLTFGSSVAIYQLASKGVITADVVSRTGSCNYQLLEVHRFDSSSKFLFTLCAMMYHHTAKFI